MIFQFCSDVERRPTRFFVAFVRPLSEPVRRFSSCSTDFSQQIAQVVLFPFLHVFSFKTVGQLQVIHQPLYRPKQIKAGEYSVGRKIGLEKVKILRKDTKAMLYFERQNLAQIISTAHKKK
jgi:hypothetical protein